VAVEIRRLEEGEVERFRSIRLRALRDAPWAFASTLEDCLAWSEETWSAQLAGIAAFVAVSDGADVGLVRGAPDRDRDDACWLISMWVAPRARGKGVGRALVDEVTRWARSARCERVLLDVVEDNRPAIALYETLGFRPTGESKVIARPGGGVIREIRYVLELARRRATTGRAASRDPA